MITREELKELLSVLNYYLIGGLMLGITSAWCAGMGGIVLVKPDAGLPISTHVITMTIIILIGAIMGLVAFLVLLPAELKLIRQKLKPLLLAQRLSGKRRQEKLGHKHHI